MCWIRLNIACVCVCTPMHKCMCVCVCVVHCLISFSPLKHIKIRQAEGHIVQSQTGPVSDSGLGYVGAVFFPLQAHTGSPETESKRSARHRGDHRWTSPHAHRASSLKPASGFPQHVFRPPSAKSQGLQCRLSPLHRPLCP